MCPSVNATSQVAKEEVPRNVLCPYYNTCLDNAVEKNLAKWDCSACIHKNTKEQIDPSEAERCGNLLYKIFNKTRHEKKSFIVKKTLFNSLLEPSTLRKWRMILEFHKRSDNL